MLFVLLSYPCHSNHHSNAGNTGNNSNSNNSNSSNHSININSDNNSNNVNNNNMYLNQLDRNMFKNKLCYHLDDTELRDLDNVIDRSRINHIYLNQNLLKYQYSNNDGKWHELYQKLFTPSESIIKNVEKVGITSGASTPEEQVNLVINFLKPFKAVLYKPFS